MNNIVPIYINSKDRNDYKNTSSTDFSVSLRKSIRNISSVDVSEIVIPKTQLLISDGNNKLTGYFCVNDLKTPILIVINKGNYTIAELTTEILNKLNASDITILFSLSWTLVYNISTFKYTSTITYNQGGYINLWGLELDYTPLVNILGLGSGYDEMTPYKVGSNTILEIGFTRAINMTASLKYNITSSILTNNINTSYMKSNNKVFNMDSKNNTIDINTRQLMNHTLYTLPDSTLAKNNEYGRYTVIKGNILVISNSTEFITMTRLSILQPFLYTNNTSVSCSKIVGISLSPDSLTLVIFSYISEAGGDRYNLNIYTRYGYTWSLSDTITNIYFNSVTNSRYPEHSVLVVDTNTIFVSVMDSHDGESGATGPKIYEKKVSWLESTITDIGNYGIEPGNWSMNSLIFIMGYNPIICDNGVIIIGQQYYGPGTDGSLTKIIKIDGIWYYEDMNSVYTKSFIISNDLKTYISGGIDIDVYNLIDGKYTNVQHIEYKLEDEYFVLCRKLCGDSKLETVFFVSDSYKHLFKLIYSAGTYSITKLTNDYYTNYERYSIIPSILYDSPGFIYSTPDDNGVFIYRDTYNRLQNYPSTSLNNQGSNVSASTDGLFVVVCNGSYDNTVLYKRINGIYLIIKRFDHSGRVSSISDDGTMVAIGNGSVVYVYRYNSNYNTWTTIILSEAFNIGYKLDMSSDGNTIITNSDFNLYKYVYNNGFWTSFLIYTTTYIRNICISGDGNVILFYSDDCYITRGGITTPITPVKYHINDSLYKTVDIDYSGNTFILGYNSGTNNNNNVIVYNYINGVYIIIGYLIYIDPIGSNFNICYTPPISISGDGKKVICGQFNGSYDLYIKQDEIWSNRQPLLNNVIIGNDIVNNSPVGQGGIFATNNNLFVSDQYYNTSIGRVYNIVLDGYLNILYTKTIPEGIYTLNQLLTKIQSLFILDSNITLTLQNDYNNVIVTAPINNTFKITGTFDKINWSNTNLLNIQKSDTIDLSINNNIIKTILLVDSSTDSLLSSSEKNINYRKYPAGYSIETTDFLDIQLRDESDRIIDLNGRDWVLTLFLTIQS